MKKILAIMLIAVIAVAGVFAAMTQIGETTNGSISLQYKIKDSFTPGFGFTVVNAQNATVDYEGTAILLGEHENEFAAGSTTITVYDMGYSNSLNDGTNKVKLTLTAPTKWAKGAIEGPAITASALVKINNPVVSGYVADGGFVVTDNATSSPTVTDTISISYLKGIVDYDTNGNKLATFNLTWPLSDQIESGTYEAAVKVEIAVI